MDWYVRWFVRSSLAWLGVGGLLGLFMTLDPAAFAYRTAHLHALVAGFVTMMIFGVAYHVMPRFAGRPLHRPSWAALHYWLANGGLLLLTAGWVVRAHGVGASAWLLPAGGFVSGAGALLFIVNIWVTVGAVTAPPRVTRAVRPELVSIGTPSSAGPKGASS